ncbi:MAG: zinc ribbon domain-containing protein [Chloroflexi bacterium]|nr:zinc ribbon domain-containing protein [Chloroflexota bacterium]
MPLYEYRCRECDTRFELLRSMSKADADAPCPECQSETTRRVPSTFAAFTSNGAGATASFGGCACAAGGACPCAAGGR